MSSGVGARLLRVVDEQRADRGQPGDDQARPLGHELAAGQVGHAARTPVPASAESERRPDLAGAEQLGPDPGDDVVERRRRLVLVDAVEHLREVEARRCAPPPPRRASSSGRRGRRTSAAAASATIASGATTFGRVAGVERTCTRREGSARPRGACHRGRAHGPALALPAAAGAPLPGDGVALQGLTVELQTFHGSDARSYHLPTIRLFADGLPIPDLERYPAAQAPLFHLLFAAYGKVVGFELWKLQALNVLISYLAVLALFHLLTARLDMQPGQGLRADAAVRAVAVLLRRLVHPAHRQPRDPLRAGGDHLVPPLGAGGVDAVVRPRLRGGGAGAAHAPGVRVAAAGRAVLRAAQGARGRRCSALSFAPLGALDRGLGRAGAQGVGPDLVRAVPEGRATTCSAARWASPSRCSRCTRWRVLGPSVWRQWRLDLLAPVGVGVALAVAVALLIAVPAGLLTARARACRATPAICGGSRRTLPLLFWVLVPAGHGGGLRARPPRRPALAGRGVRRCRSCRRRCRCGSSTRSTSTRSRCSRC